MELNDSWSTCLPWRSVVFCFDSWRHHDLADFVAGLAPDVDHLVVALAGGHETRDVLLLDLLDFLLGALDQAGLLLRHQHVVDADRDAGARGQAEARLQQLVGEDDRVLQAALAERGVDEARDFLLLQRLVDVRERQALGQDLGQQRAADGGVDQLGLGANSPFASFSYSVRRTAILRGDLDLLVVERALHFGDVGEDDALALAVDALARRVVEAQHHVLRRARSTARRWPGTGCCWTPASACALPSAPRSTAARARPSGRRRSRR